MSGTHARKNAAVAASSDRSDVALIDVLPQHRFDEQALWRYLQQSPLRIY